MSEEPTNLLEQGICPTPGCGARLPITPPPGTTLLYASFPKEVALVGDLLKGGMTRVYCPQCQQSWPYHSAVSCLVGPIRTFFAYIPTAIAQEHPEIAIEIRAGFEKIASRFEGSRIEIITDAAQYQKRLAAAISGLVLPLLNGYSLARERGDAETEIWLQQNEDQLDRNFFAGALLFEQQAIPFTALSVKSGQEEPTGEKVLQGLHDRVRAMLLLRTLRLARYLATEGLLGSIEKRVARVIHPDPVDDYTVILLAEAGSHNEQTDTTPSLHNYAYHAVLAAICDLAKRENPRQPHWAGWYTAFELKRRISSDQSSFQGLVVTPAFARRTITPEQFWDQLAPRIQAAMQQSDEAMLGILFDFAKDLGLEDLPRWVSNGIVPILDELPEEQIQSALDEVFLPLVLQSPEAFGAARSLLRSLAKRNLSLFMAFGQKLRASMLAHGQVDQSTWVTCYMSEILNELLLHRLAMQALDTWIAELKKAQSWPPASTETYVALLNEEANGLRHIGDPQEALARYDLCRQLLPDDLNVSDVRTNERNRAIVLRETGRVRESLSVLSRLLPHARGAERGLIFSSLATCLGVLGQLHQAEQTLQRALADLPKGRMVDSIRLSLLMNLAPLARQQDNFELAGAAALEAAKIARRQHNLWLELLAIGLASSSAEQLEREGGHHFERIDTALKIVRTVSRMPEAFLPPPRYDIPLRGFLAELHEAKGEVAEAERVLEQALARHSESGSDQLWELWAALARYAQMQGKSELARSRLLEARRAVMSLVTQVEAEGDPFALMVEKDLLQYMMAEEFLTAYRESKISAADLRLVADFQASVVLSRHLSPLAKAGEDAEMSVSSAPDYDEQHLGQLVAQLTSSGEKIGIVQAFEATSGLYLLLTAIAPDRVTSTLLPLRFEGNVITQLIRQTSFRLDQCRPAQRNDPLEQVPGWHEFVAALRSELSVYVSPGTHLCIIPGPLSGLPLQMALGQDYPLSYAPSLAIAQLLHTRRLQMEGGARWRSGTVSDFVVWRVGERPGVIEHFQSASAALEEKLLTLGVQYARTAGVGGTRSALFEVLQTSECVRLSCHGRARAGDLRFELLVAAEGQLPPRDDTALDSERGQGFLVDWQAISELHTCAPVVFSAACASGMAVSVRGRERIGLERPLFRAGTLSYVAPQWPVPVAQIQSLINRIMARYLADLSRPIAWVVFEEVNAAVAEGVPEWVARAVAVHGDLL
jgi:tetratricopeptide (TPR) repeat protein